MSDDYYGYHKPSPQNPYAYMDRYPAPTMNSAVNQGAPQDSEVLHPDTDPIGKAYAMVSQEDPDAMWDASLGWQSLNKTLAKAKTDLQAKADALKGQWKGSASDAYLSWIGASLYSLDQWAALAETNSETLAKLWFATQTAKTDIKNLWDEFQREAASLQQQEQKDHQAASCDPADKESADEATVSDNSVWASNTQGDPNYYTSKLSANERHYSERAANEVLHPLANSYDAAGMAMTSGQMFKGPTDAALPDTQKLQQYMSSHPPTGFAGGPGAPGSPGGGHGGAAPAAPGGARPGAPGRPGADAMLVAPVAPGMTAAQVRAQQKAAQQQALQQAQQLQAQQQAIRQAQAQAAAQQQAALQQAAQAAAAHQGVAPEAPVVPAGGMGSAPVLPAGAAAGAAGLLGTGGRGAPPAAPDVPGGLSGRGPGGSAPGAPGGRGPAPEAPDVPGNGLGGPGSPGSPMGSRPSMPGMPGGGGGGGGSRPAAPNLSGRNGGPGAPASPGRGGGGTPPSLRGRGPGGAPGEPSLGGRGPAPTLGGRGGGPGAPELPGRGGGGMPPGAGNPRAPGGGVPRSLSGREGPSGRPGRPGSPGFEEFERSGTPGLGNQRGGGKASTPESEQTVRAAVRRNLAGRGLPEGVEPTRPSAPGLPGSGAPTGRGGRSGVRSGPTKDSEAGRLRPGGEPERGSGAPGGRADRKRREEEREDVVVRVGDEELFLVDDAGQGVLAATPDAAPVKRSGPALGTSR